MAKKTAEKVQSKVDPRSLIALGNDALLKEAVKSAKRSKVFMASDSAKQWRYIDFIEPLTGRPCLPFEYLFGCRGLITGRSLRLEGDPHQGKSALVWLLLGMGYKSGNGAHRMFFDTEFTPLSPDFVSALGGFPESVLIEQPSGLTYGLERVIDKVMELRARVDAKRVLPIMAAIDSISGLGVPSDDADGFAMSDSGKTSNRKEEGGGVGVHSRKFSEWLRNNTAFFSFNDVVVIMTAQSREDIKASQNQFMAFGAEPTTTIANRPTKFHATWAIPVSSSHIWDDVLKQVVGDTLKLRMVKNKVDGQIRSIALPLFTGANGKLGFDFTESNIDLMFKDGGLDPKECSRTGAWLGHERINGGKKTQDREAFVSAVLENQELVMQIRERLEIRGWGFKFEQSCAPAEDLESDFEPEALKVLDERQQKIDEMAKQKEEAHAEKKE